MELNIISSDFWKNKKIFLTGNTGFKGSWTSMFLNYLGAKVYGFSLAPNTKPSLFNILNLNEVVQYQEGNINDYDLLNKNMVEVNPDIVIHMAAQPLVRASYIDPLETFRTNVIGTSNVLQSARFCESVKVILNVTTDKCYENKEDGKAFMESDTLGGHDPYSSSKACSELVTDSFRKSYFNNIGVGVATARAGNVIGGGDWSEDRLIPDVIRQVYENENLSIRNPKATRPWQHVFEPILGYLILIEKLYESNLEYSTSFNFGPEESNVLTVKQILDLAKEKNNLINYDIDVNEHAHEAELLMLDINKAKKHLSWRPKMSIDDTILATLSWYENYYQSNEIYEYSEQAVKKFIKGAS
jgi:CDP-glucose 4,6-dehydratase